MSNPKQETRDYYVSYHDNFANFNWFMLQWSIEKIMTILSYASMVEQYAPKRCPLTVRVYMKPIQVIDDTLQSVSS